MFLSMHAQRTKNALKKYDGKSRKMGAFLKKACDLAPNNPYTLFRIAFLFAVEKKTKEPRKPWTVP